MKKILKLNQQIADTEFMIQSTKKLLENTPDDKILLFTINQDETLLKSLKQDRTSKQLNYFKEIRSSPDILLNDLYTPPFFYIDPFDITKKIGISVIKNDSLGDDEAGKCYINDEIIIEYKSQYNHNRERFTVAHELGHIIKHMPYANNPHHFEDSQELLYARNDYIDSSNTIEKEADSLAGYILIPKGSIEILLDSLEPLEQLSTKMLQDLFQVSEGAIYHALKNYNLLDSPKIKRDFSWS